MDLTDQQIKELEAEHNCVLTTINRAERKYHVPYATLLIWVQAGKLDSLRYKNKYAVIVNKKFQQKVNRYKPKKQKTKSLIEAYVTSSDYRKNYISERLV
jgi:predicted site-specific integrase-resolvase